MQLMTLKKNEERGKTTWEQTPPQNTMHQKKKRKLLGNCVLHSNMIPQCMKVQYNEGLGEDVDSLFRGRKELQINDPAMY
jgi:hypothetical protein